MITDIGFVNSVINCCPFFNSSFGMLSSPGAFLFSLFCLFYHHWFWYLSDFFGFLLFFFVLFFVFFFADICIQLFKVSFPVRHQFVVFVRICIFHIFYLIPFFSVWDIFFFIFFLNGCLASVWPCAESALRLLPPLFQSVVGMLQWLCFAQSEDPLDLPAMIRSDFNKFRSTSSTAWLLLLFLLLYTFSNVFLFVSLSMAFHHTSAPCL